VKQLQVAKQESDARIGFEVSKIKDALTQVRTIITFLLIAL
jgi:hypothetical protein